MQKSHFPTIYTPKAMKNNNITTAPDDLKQEIEKLRTAIGKQERFWANAFHDLKNYVAPIALYSEMLGIDGITEAKTKELAVKISKCCDLLTNLLTKMSNISKAQCQLISVNKKKFNIAHLATKTIGMYESLCFDKGITMENKLDETQEVYADYSMIYSLLNNLLGNAVKFTPRGGHIEISGHRLEGDMLEIRVKDSGVGIDIEKFNLMLTEDKCFTTPGTEGEAGTGFGLLLCRELVADNGGTFRAERNADRGSTLAFTLPL